MRWMKLTTTEGDPAWLNMARAESFYRENEDYTSIAFGTERWSVKETPEQIIAAGQWEVREAT